MEKSRHIKKESVIEALKKSLGVVTTALTRLDIPSSTYYKWLKTDPEFAQEVKDIENIALDFSESKMFEAINKGSEGLIKFHLSRKGKNRGYVERQEITGMDGQPTHFQIEIIDSGSNKDQD